MRYKRKRDKCFWTMARSYLHDYMPAIRNLSDKTIETYKQSLKTYLRFLKEKKNIEDELGKRQTSPRIKGRHPKASCCSPRWRSIILQHIAFFRGICGK